MVGRRARVRQVVETLLHESGMPKDFVPAAMWIAKPRVIIGLARRRVLAGGRKGSGDLRISLGLQQAAFQVVWNQKIRGGVGGHVSDPT